MKKEDKNSILKTELENQMQLEIDARNSIDNKALAVIGTVSGFGLFYLVIQLCQYLALLLIILLV